MSLLIYKILNYDRFDKIKMTIDLSSILDDQSTKITTMAASVLQLCHKTAQKKKTLYCKCPSSRRDLRVAIGVFAKNLDDLLRSPEWLRRQQPLNFLVLLFRCAQPANPQLTIGSSSPFAGTSKYKQLSSEVPRKALQTQLVYNCLRSKSTLHSQQQACIVLYDR